MSALASDSSLDSLDLDSRHSYPNCNSRMSSLNYDKHKICNSCSGQDCDSENKCIECFLWTNDVFDKYFKYRKSLLSKTKSKKACKDASSKPSGKSLVGQVQGDPSMTNESVPVGISDRVKILIADSLAQLSSSFSSSRQESFARIVNLISLRLSEINVSQDCF